MSKSKHNGAAQGAAARNETEPGAERVIVVGFDYTVGGKISAVDGKLQAKQLQALMKQMGQIKGQRRPARTLQSLPAELESQCDDYTEAWESLKIDE